MGPDLDRRARKGTRRGLLARPPRAHRWRRRDSAPGPTPRRAPVAATRHSLGEPQDDGRPTSGQWRSAPGNRDRHHRFPEGFSAFRGPRQRGTRHRPGGYCRSGSATSPGRRQLRLPSADRDGRAIVIMAGLSFTAQSLRGHLRRERPRHRTRSGWQQERSVGSGHGGRPRALSRATRARDPRTATRHAGRGAPRSARWVATGSRRPDSRCRPLWVDQAHSSGWCEKGSHKPGGNPPYRWRRRWRRRWVACRPGSCSPPYAPRPSRSTSPRPRSPDFGGIVICAGRGSRRAIRWDRGWDVR